MSIDGIDIFSGSFSTGNIKFLQQKEICHCWQI